MDDVVRVSPDCALMVAVPMATACTTPLAETDAMRVSDDDQVRGSSMTSPSASFAKPTSDKEPPTVSQAFAGVTSIDSTGLSGG
jgi:hypothetical protein